MAGIIIQINIIITEDPQQRQLFHISINFKTTSKDNIISIKELIQIYHQEGLSKTLKIKTIINKYFLDKMLNNKIKLQTLVIYPNRTHQQISQINIIITIIIITITTELHLLLFQIIISNNSAYRTHKHLHLKIHLHLLTEALQTIFIIIE